MLFFLPKSVSVRYENPLVHLPQVIEALLGFSQEPPPRIWLRHSHGRTQDQAEPSTLYQSTLSIVPLHIQDRVTTTISTIYGSAALSWRHGKSASEPILPTRPGVKGVKKVFENLFRRIAAKCEEVSSSTEAFKPSRMLLEQRGLRDNKSAVRIPGHPYMGDMSSNSFLAQIPDLEDNENCALWLQNVPVGVIEADFFKVINTDGVWCLHINSANEVHPEQAAKLVFSKYIFKLQPIISISDARERDTIPLSTPLPTT